MRLLASAIHLVFSVLCLTGSTSFAAETSWPAHVLRGANISVDITETDLRELKTTWKANAVRLLHLNPLSNTPPYKTDSQIMERIYKTIDLAHKLGFYVIFSPGVSFDNHDQFFTSAEFRLVFLEFWKRFAGRFSNRPVGIAYDLMNEPHDEAAKTQWSGYAKELTHAIRLIDREHTIVVEPPEWGWPAGFEFFQPTGDTNTVYSFHYYGPMDFTHQRNEGILKATREQWQKLKYPGLVQQEQWNKARLDQDLAKARAFAEKYKVKIYCGEFGTVRWAIGATTWYQDMLDILETSKMSWTFYSFREWYAMDIEMDLARWMEKTPRRDTELGRLLRKRFQINSE